VPNTTRRASLGPSSGWFETSISVRAGP